MFICILQFFVQRTKKHIDLCRFYPYIALQHNNGEASNGNSNKKDSEEGSKVLCVCPSHCSQQGQGTCKAKREERRKSR